MIGYKIEGKQLDDLRRKAESIGAGEDVIKAAAVGAAELTRDHLFAKDALGNIMGGKRTHFYSDAAKSVSDPTASGGTASFTISKLGLAQRWLGGDIKAGKGISSATGEPTKYLSIPARTETYGQPPSAFTDLKFIPRKNGGAMLVQALQQRVTFGKKGVRKGSVLGGLVMYWLVEEVHQEPDPSVMPTEEKLLAAAILSGSEYLERKLAA